MNNFKIDTYLVLSVAKSVYKIYITENMIKSMKCANFHHEIFSRRKKTWNWYAMMQQIEYSLMHRKKNWCVMFRDAFLFQYFTIWSFFYISYINYVLFLISLMATCCKLSIKSRLKLITFFFISKSFQK